MTMFEALKAHLSFVSSINHSSSGVVYAPPTFVLSTLIFPILAKSALISSSVDGANSVGSGCDA